MMWLLICCLTSKLRIFRSYGDVNLSVAGYKSYAFEQRGIFVVTHLLWHGASVSFPKDSPNLAAFNAKQRYWGRTLTRISIRSFPPVDQRIIIMLIGILHLLYIFVWSMNFFCFSWKVFKIMICHFQKTKVSMMLPNLKSISANLLVHNIFFSLTF